MIGRLKILVLGAAALAVLAAAPARSHSFDVALIFAGQAAAPEAQRRILAGFRVAAAERDSHPGETSDGHLGGLDVYITVIAAPEHAAGADIAVAFAGEAVRRLLETALAGTGAVVLPGAPVPPQEDAARARFLARFLDATGEAADADAMLGYHAARRIDAAVRAQDGVDDRAALAAHFAATQGRFAW